MKIRIALLLYFNAFFLHAQEPNATSDELRKLQETLAAYQQRIEALEAKQRQDSIAFANTTQSIQGFREKLGVKPKGEWDLLKNNQINVVSFYRIFNSKLNLLSSYETIEAYNNHIKSITNPQSKELGFSIQEIVKELMDAYITKDKKITSSMRSKEKDDATAYNAENDRIRSFVEVIINPLGDMVATATGLTSVVSLTKNLITFIAGTALQRKEITVQDVHKFNQELDRYMNFYGKLEDAKNIYEFSLSRTKNDIALMHSKLKEHVINNVKALKIKVRDQKPEESIGDYLNYVFNDVYTEESVRNIFVQLEGTNPDFEKLIKANPSIVLMNNSLDDVVVLFKQFDYLYN
ncbi:MAG: hypothetical protein NZ521_10420, partial [Flammeovirgaceae bacterium]|nr:hypothetical protein [Flammeovirgaceae bacterium]MDW8288637.1 hypothetical protein [Flammeovirgaceae bacterium]